MEILLALFQGEKIATDSLLKRPKYLELLNLYDRLSHLFSIIANSDDVLKRDFNLNLKMQKAVRHILATIAYRFGKIVIDVDAQFGDFEAGKGVKKPNEIVNHITKVLLFAKEAFGEERPGDLKLLDFEAEVARFYVVLKELDLLICDVIIRDLPYYKLIQGPLADILTHVGQLALLRRLFGKSIDGEDFMEADIQSGRF